MDPQPRETDEQPAETSVSGNGSGGQASPPLELPAGSPPPKALPAPKQQTARRTSFAWVWLLLLAGVCYFGYRYWQGAQQKQAAAAQAQAAKAAKRPVPVVGTA